MLKAATTAPRAYTGLHTVRTWRELGVPAANSTELLQLPERSVRFVSDSNLFLDRAVAAGGDARPVFDDVLAHPDVRLHLPDRIELEITRNDVFGTQAARLRDAADKIERSSVDVQSILDEYPNKILSRRFGIEDLQLLETARQRGLPVVTSNSALVAQISSNATRSALFGNVKVLVPFADFSTAEELVNLLKIGSH